MAQSITLQTSDSDVVSDDVLGRVSFAASSESSGSDAILIGGSIYAAAESTFTAIANPTSIFFATANSETATAKLKLTSGGHLYPVTTQVYDVGGSSNQFRNMYFYNTLYVNGTQIIDRSSQTIGTDGYSLASGMIIDGGTP